MDYTELSGVVVNRREGMFAVLYEHLKTKAQVIAVEANDEVNVILLYAPSLVGV